MMIIWYDIHEADPYPVINLLTHTPAGTVVAPFSGFRLTPFVLKAPFTTFPDVKRRHEESDVTGFPPLAHT